jgi:lipopolysaccharide transport system permease protein
VFGKLIGIPTGKSIPPVLFYFSGIILWNFFSDAFWGISNTFRDHIHLYSKVYFPRIIIPLSILSTNFLRFAIQFILLILLIVYYAVFKNYSFELGPNLLAVPIIFIGIAMISASCGLMAALLSARYRDLTNFIAIILRLLMFITPVLYPLSVVSEELKWIALLNPLTPLFEWFRLGMLGEGTVEKSYLMYSFLFGFTALVISIFLFNTRSSKLIDIA